VFSGISANLYFLGFCAQGGDPTGTGMGELAIYWLVSIPVSHDWSEKIFLQKKTS